MRVGQGFDAHRFAPERPLMLGCVQISESGGLGGHSDADVLAHAIADALLGAAGLGDLGTHFPGNERWREASGVDILKETARLVGEAGYRILSVDSTVVAESPRLAPHRSAMQTGVSDALGVDAELVSVKSTTTDGMGWIGRAEGIAAMAVAAVEPVG